MAYDKTQATHEFTRWSESYDRSILQWLLFAPSHRALIRRIASVVGDRPARLLDVGCGTGVFAGRLRQALPRIKVVGDRPRPRHASEGFGSMAPVQRRRATNPGRQRTAAVRRRRVRLRHLRQQLSPLSAPGSGCRRDASGVATRRPAHDRRWLSRRPLGLAHLRRLRRRRGRSRPPCLFSPVPRHVCIGRTPSHRAKRISRPRAVSVDRGRCCGTLIGDSEPAFSRVPNA